MRAHEQRLEDVRMKLQSWAEKSGADRNGRGPRPGAEPPKHLAVVFDIDEVLLERFHMNSFVGI